MIGEVGEAPPFINKKSVEEIMRDERFILLNTEIGPENEKLKTEIEKSASLIRDGKYIEAQETLLDERFLESVNLDIEWYHYPLGINFGDSPLTEQDVNKYADTFASQFRSMSEDTIRIGEFAQSNGSLVLPEVLEREKALLTIEEFIHKLQNRNAEFRGLSYASGIKELEVALFLHKLGVPLSKFFINGEPLYSRDKLGISPS